MRHVWIHTISQSQGKRKRFLRFYDSMTDMLGFMLLKLRRILIVKWVRKVPEYIRCWEENNSCSDYKRDTRKSEISNTAIARVAGFRIQIWCIQTN